MPEFHALEGEHQRWKTDVLSGRIVLENLATDGYDIYAHQEPGQQRETPEELKRRMAEKDRAKAAAAAK
jgi:hypothetical protein